MRNDGENESGGKRRGGWREPGLSDRGGFHGPACSHSSDQIRWASVADSHLQDRKLISLHGRDGNLHNQSVLDTRACV